MMLVVAAVVVATAVMATVLPALVAAVVAAMRVTGTGALSGVNIDAEVFYVFGFRDGQVVAATTYLTQREALADVGLAEPPI